MYMVERAIIMAAGIGNRMQPVTLETPKPMVEVNGVSMIETVIEGLLENDIDEIYIVVGYLKEKMYELKKKYPNLTFIENPYYDTCNNISSLYVAREHLANSIILDGDQIIYNPRILEREFYKSGYNAVWTEDKTEEWLMQLENETVVSCSRTGGEKGWQLYSISRWNGEDAEKLRKHLEYEFETAKRQDIYWDDVAMFLHIDDFDLGIKEMKKDDIKEIDNLEELVQIDPIYEKFLNGGSKNATE